MKGLRLQLVVHTARFMALNSTITLPAQNSRFHLHSSTRLNHKQFLPAFFLVCLMYIFQLYKFTGRTRWRSWLRHCGTSREVAGSIHDGVTGIFQWESFRSHCGPGIDSASNRNEYQESFLGVRTAGSYAANCLEILEPQPPGTPRARLGL